MVDLVPQTVLIPNDRRHSHDYTDKGETHVCVYMY